MAKQAKRFLDLNVQGDLVSTYPLSFRNRIINGNFDIWQRGTSFSSISAYTYTADRWLSDGAVTSVARSGTQNNVMTVVTQAGTGMAQRIETAGGGFLSGQTYTVSGLVNASVANLTVTVTYRAGNTFKSTIHTANVSSQLTAGSYSRFTTTFTLANAPTDFAGTDCIQVSFTSSVVNTINFQNVQFESGSSATPFERRPIGTELALCQRYYQFLQTALVVPQVGAATEVILQVQPSCAMRNGNSFYSTPVGSLTVSLANADYVAGAVTGNQWTLYKPGVGYSTKTGTISWTNENSFHPMIGTVIPSSGATFGANACRLSASGTSGIYLNCEL